MNIDKETNGDLSFLRSLDESGFFRWPIDFELSELNYFDASSWFENAIEEYSKHRFIEFAKDGTGSGFCLWFYPSLGESRPPVVFWGSEGEFYFVSGTISDFVKQLCSGKLFFDGGWLPPAEEDAGEIDWRDLKRRAEEYLGKWQQSPEEILSSGRQKHPDFESWVNEHWQ